MPHQLERWGNDVLPRWRFGSLPNIADAAGLQILPELVSDTGTARRSRGMEG